MNYSKQYINEIAQKSGFLANNTEKVIRLLDVLKFIDEELNRIFKNNKKICGIELEIITNKKKYKEKIIAKTDNFLLTNNNEKIYIILFMSARRFFVFGMQGRRRGRFGFLRFFR